MELENYYLIAITIIINTRNISGGAKTDGGKAWWDMRHLHSLNVSVSQILTAK